MELRFRVFLFLPNCQKKNVKVNSLTPVSDQDNLSLQYLYNIIQASDENKEKISMGLLNDPIPSSPN